MKLTADVLNHLLRQTPGASAALRPHAGKCIKISLSPAAVVLQIDGLGEFTPAPPEAAIDGQLSITPTAALRLLAEADAATHLVSISGDTQLATEVGKVLRTLRWDIEEDLSHWIGDIPAHEFTTLTHRFTQTVRRQLQSLAETFAEYWLEEQPLIAKKRHIDHFCREVDQMRQDIDRLEKQIARLEKIN